MNRNVLEKYQEWRKKAVSDVDIVKELDEILDDEEKIIDAFYCNLTFGTGGLRGIIGAGTNRLNVYTVAKASQGLADYMLKTASEKHQKIAISYDSRIKSELFAQTAAGVFAANGIKVYIYQCLMPTPCLSFAVRELGCGFGVMITASHNPAAYNGYKVYDASGCQITTKTAGSIFDEIEKLDIFNDIKSMEYSRAVDTGIVEFISEDIYNAYVDAVKKQSLLDGLKVDREISIIYSPLNGTGLHPVLRVLHECGYHNIVVVKEQELPNGEFPTCPCPNPENREALELGIEYAKKYKADLLLATDPDCDRIGMAVKNLSGEYELLSGNEVGLLLLDYICARRKAMHLMPQDPVFIKTIVTTDLAERIAAHYGVRTVNVLTGFKFIGEQIGELEKAGKTDSYVFGFEESYGYLSGSYVRDKDAVVGALLICEMYAYYTGQGIGLPNKLDELYERFGYCLNTSYSYKFEGQAGAVRMKKVMERFRKGINSIAGKKVTNLLDYSVGIDDLPKSDVLKFFVENSCSVVIRPSGTEPKLKVYVSVMSESRKSACAMEKKIIDEIKEYFIE